MLRHGLYHIVYIEQPAAPADLLKFLRCKCKLYSKSPCSKNCSCKEKIDYTVLHHVDNVAVTAVRTKIPQRVLRTISVKKMTKEIFLTYLICLKLKSTSMRFFKR